MSYYDNVKDNVKDKKTNSAGAPSFDTLKEAAEETSVDEDEGSDDGTPIEVLEEGGLKEDNSSNQKKSRQTSSESQAANNNSAASQSADMSSIEQKLDKMIEQNQKIIEVLESFGQ